MRYLSSQWEAINNGRQEWARLLESLSRDSEKPDTISVEECLRDLSDALIPCLKVKRVELDFPQSGDTRAISFQQDVEAVLKEIIVGALSELPDHGDTKTITIEVKTADSRAEVRFRDNLGPMKDVEAINTGHSIISDPEFGREWGLSVAQLVALRSGGELFLESQTDGNVITYFIPLAHHA